jgi:uncharacterized repeat protein (TIGR03943 family)
VSPDVSASTVLLVGVMLVRIVLSDVYQRYVRVGMGPWLLVSGVLLISLGLVMVVRALRTARVADDADQGHHDAEGHLHVGGDRVGWLLLLPVLALLLVAPPALGSYGVDRAANVRVAQGAAVWSVLPRSATPHAMTLLELNERAWDRKGASLAEATVELTGFVAAGSEAGAFRLARYQIACCAADAVPSVAHVTGLSGAVPTRDSWARVIGRFTGNAADGLPVVEATSVQSLPIPVDPYE